MRRLGVYLMISIVIAFTGSSMAKKPLKKYYERRDIATSGEPGDSQGKKRHNKAIFVVQKHDASHLHYDFRLEIDGVLVSWAVPKGPSLNPSIKRLAVLTEDHPMDYASFEGTIPEGNYGAGQVIVWDKGIYQNIKEINGKSISMKECFKRGTIEIVVYGKKLHGAYALIRTHLSEKEPWLLIKMNDEYADKRRNIVVSNPESVLSGETIKDTRKPDISKKNKTHAKQNDDPEIKIGKYSVHITHPDKVIVTKPKIVKQQLLDYYQAIAPTMLPYLKDRPLVMQRFVDGINQEGFYQKEAAEYFPDYIKRMTVQKEGGVVHHALVNNAASLVYLANQLVIVFHVWLSKTNNLNKPDHIIFDLDPSSNDFSQVRNAALNLKKLLTHLGLVPFVMTTGSRGLHVLVPIKPQENFDAVREFARDVAQLMVEQFPETLTLEMRKEKRGDKIFVDYLRNGFAATGVAPYSVRARPGLPVATPLTWNEVSKATLKPDQWNIKNIFKRLARKGDPWKNMLKHAQSLKTARKKLEKLIGEETV